MYKSAVAIVLSYYLSNPAYAFVENVSHGYLNCMACHISPNGGGLLNNYGRSLSKELMSTWGWKNSENPLFLPSETPGSFAIGGDYRAIQIYFENSEIIQRKQFEMQKNLELGLNFKNLWFISSFGTQEGPKGTPDKGTFISERHFALWEISDELKLRAGKFRMNFGLQDPNHTRLTKKTFGFGPNSESYILEVSKFTEISETVVSADLGRIDIPNNQESERSLSINYTKYSSNKSKFGGNALFGDSNERRRSLFGLHGIGGFSNSWIYKFEIDYQIAFELTKASEDFESIAGLSSLGYQLTKGLQSYFVVEILNNKGNTLSSRQIDAGLGAQWLPIPHFEILAEYKKVWQKVEGVERSNLGWILFHFYL